MTGAKSQENEESFTFNNQIKPSGSSLVDQDHAKGWEVAPDTERIRELADKYDLKPKQLRRLTGKMNGSGEEPEDLAGDYRLFEHEVERIAEEFNLAVEQAGELAREVRVSEEFLQALGLDYQVHVPEGGKMVSVVNKPAVRQSRPTGGGDRGLCHRFSKRSQKKLRKNLFTTDFEGARKSGLDCFFVTLTYGKSWPEVEMDELQEWIEESGWEDDQEVKHPIKKDLNAFWMRMCRKLGTDRGDPISFWKLEAQDRGAPHFHIVLLSDLGVEDLGDMREYFARAWNEIVHSNATFEWDRLEKANHLEQHRSRDEFFQRVDEETKQNVLAYLLKYTQKQEKSEGFKQTRKYRCANSECGHTWDPEEGDPEPGHEHPVMLGDVIGSPGVACLKSQIDTDLLRMGVCPECYCSRWEKNGFFWGERWGIRNRKRWKKFRTMKVVRISKRQYKELCRKLAEHVLPDGVHPEEVAWMNHEDIGIKDFYLRGPPLRRILEECEIPVPGESMQGRFQFEGIPA